MLFRIIISYVLISSITSIGVPTFPDPAVAESPFKFTVSWIHNSSSVWCIVKRTVQPSPKSDSVYGSSVDCNQFTSTAVVPPSQMKDTGLLQSGQFSAAGITLLAGAYTVCLRAPLSTSWDVVVDPLVVAGARTFQVEHASRPMRLLISGGGLSEFDRVSLISLSANSGNRRTACTPDSTHVYFIGDNGAINITAARVSIDISVGRYSLCYYHASTKEWLSVPALDGSTSIIVTANQVYTSFTPSPPADVTAPTAGSASTTDSDDDDRATVLGLAIGLPVGFCILLMCLCVLLYVCCWDERSRSFRSKKTSSSKNIMSAESPSSSGSPGIRSIPNNNEDIPTAPASPIFDPVHKPIMINPLVSLDHTMNSAALEHGTLFAVGRNRFELHSGAEFNSEVAMDFRPVDAGNVHDDAPTHYMFIPIDLSNERSAARSPSPPPMATYSVRAPPPQPKPQPDDTSKMPFFNTRRPNRFGPSPRKDNGGTNLTVTSVEDLRDFRPSGEPIHQLPSTPPLLRHHPAWRFDEVRPTGQPVPEEREAPPATPTMAWTQPPLEYTFTPEPVQMVQVVQVPIMPQFVGMQYYPPPNLPQETGTSILNALLNEIPPEREHKKHKKRKQHRPSETKRIADTTDTEWI